MSKFPRLRSTYLYERRYIPTKAQRKATLERLEYHRKSSLYVNVDIMKRVLISFLKELNLAANRKMELGRHTIKSTKGRLFFEKKDIFTFPVYEKGFIFKKKVIKIIFVSRLGNYFLFKTKDKYLRQVIESKKELLIKLMKRFGTEAEFDIYIK